MHIINLKHRKDQNKKISGYNSKWKRIIPSMRLWVVLRGWFGPWIGFAAGAGARATLGPAKQLKQISIRNAISWHD